MLNEQITQRRSHNETINYLSVMIASEITLVCAALLFFFVYLNVPLSLATGGALVAILVGSVFCWRSIVTAEAIFMFAVLGNQIIILDYFPSLVWPFVVMDLLIMAWLSTLWSVDG
ncbi:MAG: hypothetical protein NT051_02305 [Candidatus Micrarchaeota archaeon]|nr:hypothetical protein [Candidatus Micrarchaeota archaeon]